MKTLAALMMLIAGLVKGITANNLSKKRSTTAAGFVRRGLRIKSAPFG
jgi:hypothetical protein